MCQYPLGAPSTSITFGMTLRKCPTYRLHTSGVMVFQNALMPIQSSCVFLGLAVDRQKFFIVPQTFSIRFRSGLEAGVFHQFMSFS